MTEAEWLARRASGGDDEAFLRMLTFACGEPADPVRRKSRLLLCANFRRRTVAEGDHRDICRQAAAVAEDYADGLATRAQADAALESLRRLDEWRYRDRAEYYIYPITLLEDALGPAVSTTMVYRGLCARTDMIALDNNEIPYDLLVDLFGNPFRSVTLDPSWLTPTVVALASQMYESRDFADMPILADGLEDAGCESPSVLGHCRGPGPHFRGCWVVDAVLNKE